MRGARAWRLMLALVPALLFAAPASADYRRLPGPPPDGNLVVVDGTVLVAGGGSLVAHAPDGSTRVIGTPAGLRFDWIAASRDAAAAVAFPASGGRVRGIYGPAAGPLRNLRFPWVNVAVSGRHVLVFSSRSGTVRVIDTRSGRERRIGVRGQLSQMQADGRYFAYSDDRGRAFVRSVASGRLAYRVRASGRIRLGPGGRIVAHEDGHLRVATPGRPRLARLRTVGLGSPYYEVGRDGVLVARGDPRARTEVALLGWNGRLRPLTPLLPGVGALAWDGRTIAFQVGDCVFAGPVPAVGAPLPPVAAEGCIGSVGDGGAGR